MSVIGGAASALSGLASAGGPPGGATLPRPNINHSSTPALVEALRHAIMCGDENQARQMAAQLSRQRARLHIQLDVVSPSSALDQEVRTKVYIEDKTDSGGFMWMNLKPSMTIRDLKRKMLLEYGFPTEVQNWVIGKRIGKDDETLFRLNVRTAGEIIYLYLVSAKSVNLTRQLYRDRFNGHLWPDEEELEEYEAHVHQVAAGAGGGGDVGGPSRGPARRLQTELRDIRPHTVQTGGEGSPGGADLHAGAPSQRGAQFTSSHATQLPPQSPTTQPQKVGWDCPKCTFLNPPTRPGCKMCGEARPDDYQIPIDYEMTPEEEERIQREMQLDDMVQQAEQLARGDEVENQLQLTEEQLDHLLCLNDYFNAIQQNNDSPVDAQNIGKFLRLNDAVMSLRNRYPHLGLGDHDERPDSDDDTHVNIVERDVPSAYISRGIDSDNLMSAPGIYENVEYSLGPHQTPPGGGDVSEDENN